MRFACLCLGIACALAVFAPPVYPQTMLEYGVSAAGGSTMGVAGKGVSNSLDTIFRKLDKQTGDAAATADRPAQPAQQEQKVTESPAAGPLPDAPQVSPNPVTTPSLAAMEREWENAANWHPSPSQPEPAPLTREDLEAVGTGEARDDVVARLGAPSARIVIPEGGHLEEVYLYNPQRTHLGKVTLVDGAVSAVNVE